MRVVIAEPRAAAAVERIVILLMARDLIDEGTDVERDDLVALTLLARRWSSNLIATLMDAAREEVRKIRAPVSLERFFALADAWDGAALGAA